ncbi:DUF4913 domain-containing protein (plasmid) [Arthrobacter sp. FW305-BF8]|uniref:DUF4913 domain-containing protein n=1 Tax=Arthrobacter sp. FW305-BF8 TaxID=2879617 RepID=UPI001F35CB82|nr:DUF4913 domain-containing protein [Arthrobacter sp. FW305-BF8]UKA56706.1 DUF4913 domain-containing protein [Arthrobacter sp. FW305-BF8]
MTYEPGPEEDPMPHDAWYPPEDTWLPPDNAAPSVPARADGRTGESTGPPAPARAYESGQAAGAVRSPGPDVAGVEAIPELLERMGAVEELAAGLFEEISSAPAGGPWYWADLNPEQARDLWAELDGFVVWLQNRILRHSSNSAGWIPACWYRHPDAVELLTALMVAHKAAYRSKNTKPGFELTEWFTRALWPTMDSLAQRMTFKNCMEGQGHFDATSPGLQLTAASDDFTAFLNQENTAQETGGQETAGAAAGTGEPAHA